MKYQILLLMLPILIFGKASNVTVDFQQLIEHGKKIVNIDRDTFILVNLKESKIEGIINEKFALQKVINPGSTFKLVTAIAALKRDLCYLSFKNYCNDQFFIFGKSFINRHIHFHISEVRLGDYYRCSKIGGHGNIGFKQAITKSCNHYFWNLGDRIGYERIYNTAINLGFNKKVFEKLNEEEQGYILYQESRPKQLLSYIGEGGGIKATPMQMALFVQYIANQGKGKAMYMKYKGKLYKSRVMDQRKQFLRFIPYIQAGLVTKVSTSTDYFDKNNILTSLKGKTGTASYQDSKKSYGWFLGYAPVKNPVLAFVIVIQEGSGKEALEKLTKIIFNY